MLPLFIMPFATHILVPTDFSDAAKLATDAAAMLAKRLGTHVTLLHVHDPDGLRAPAHLAYSPTREKDIDAEVRAWIDQRLAELRDSTFDGVDVTVAHIADESPAHAICAHAEKVGADLIVIATHGRTGLKHLLIGSVAERVVRHAKMPVLTLRSNAED
ncbi:MAG: universal stress protein [Sandaracinaceae bacterium]|nr:universal stress protein [Sandaracinaceae bacterium]